jgi:hypothetical protein
VCEIAHAIALAVLRRSDVVAFDDRHELILRFLTFRMRQEFECVHGLSHLFAVPYRAFREKEKRCPRNSIGARNALFRRCVATGPRWMPLGEVCEAERGLRQWAQPAPAPVFAAEDGRGRGLSILLCTAALGASLG